MSKTCKQFDVLRVVEMIPDRLDQGRLVFKDTNGKIVFIDKNEKCMNKVSLVVGDKYLVWIVNEFDKQAYCRFTIDGVTVESFVNEVIAKFTLEDLLKINPNNELVQIVMLSNYIYNHDTVFNNHTDEQLPILDSDLKRISESININSELDEFRYELVIALAYIKNRYINILNRS